MAPDRLYAALFAVALLTRLGLAVLTEFNQLFPDYYFNDAVLYDELARRILAAWEGGGAMDFISPGMETFALCVAALYKLAVPAPVVVKLVNALLGALCCAAAAWTAAAVGGRRAGVLAFALAALWPSHAFYTSQAFKETPTLFFLSLALGCAAAALSARRRGRRGALGATGALCIVAAGFFRPHLVPFLALAGAAGALALTARSGRRAFHRALTVLVFMSGGAALYKPVKLACEPHMFGAQVRAAPFLRALDVAGRPAQAVEPYSPAGITEYRRARQLGNRVWARTTSGREVETEFFPDASFAAWLDVAVFLPKASFYELFMPLPGLYPLAGKPGRALAGAENVFVLLGVGAACLGLWRYRRRPAAWALATFCAVLTPAAALFEFDLGSASRHRLQPLSAALPLAAAALAAKRPRRA